MSSRSNYLIDLMTWSYSRLSTFYDCPYRFYLRYIEGAEGGEPGFFAEYGKLVHDILAGFYRREIDSAAASTEFMRRFAVDIVGRPPSPAIRGSYFKDGLKCMENLKPIEGSVEAVEQQVHFSIDGVPFVGYIDLICLDEDGALCIVDHKNKVLSPKSKRKNPTKSDLELDEYLKQLYLYSLPVYEQYGKYPDFLAFYCYRQNIVIKEPFHLHALESTKAWALNTIDAIRREEAWRPNLDSWKCRHFCEYCRQCEYAQTGTL